MANFKCEKFKKIQGSYLSSFDSSLRDAQYELSDPFTKAKITRSKADKAAMARALNSHMARCRVCS